jgi:hypothetical protein
LPREGEEILHRGGELAVAVLDREAAAAAQAEEGDDPGWAKLGRTAGCLRPARKNSGKRKKRPAREFWARLIFGCAEKKKKIFRF